MIDQDRGAPAPVDVRMNALRAVAAERSEDRVALGGSILIGVPVIVAVGVVLQNSTRAGEFCESPLYFWCIVEAARMAFNIVLYLALVSLDPRSHTSAKKWVRILQNFQGMAFIVIFMLGNLWLFNSNCQQTAPQLYALQLSLIVLGYISLFLPCALFIVFLPFACCCFPCLIRVLNRFGPVAVTGATHSQLDTLHKVKAAPGLFSTPEDARCSICLAEYIMDEDLLRWLPCGHHYHKACCDEWLILNSSCPTCRKDPFDASGEIV